jgi:hypothetical protein
MINFIILMKILISYYTLTNVCINVSEAAAAGLAQPLPHSATNLKATAPFNYNFPAPLNAIQRLAQIASHPNSLRDAVRAAVENLIPPIAGLPAIHPTITIEGINAKVKTATTDISQRMVTQLAAILSPNATTARDAIMNSDSTVTEPDAQANFNDFQTMYAMSPAAANALAHPLIFVPAPANPGLQKCNTKHAAMDTLENIVTVIRKAYYNIENLRNLGTHVNDRHIGDTATPPDPNASRFDAENIHAAMHYIRFVLNLILPENIALNIIRGYPPNKSNGLPPDLEDNIIYIKYQRDSEYPTKSDITIYYKFSYGIGRERTASLASLRVIRIGLGNHTRNVAGILAPAPWHLKTAFPAAS